MNRGVQCESDSLGAFPTYVDWGNDHLGVRALATNVQRMRHLSGKKDCMCSQSCGKGKADRTQGEDTNKNVRTSRAAACNCRT